MRIGARQVGGELAALGGLERPRQTAALGFDSRDLLLPAITQRLPATDDTSRLLRVDATLGRVATHLRGIQQTDGRWDGLYRGGCMHMALSAIAFADVGASTSRAREPEVIAHFGDVQHADGGFPVFPGEPSDAATTRMVSVALEMLAKRQPGLAAKADAIRERCAAFLAATPATTGDGVYALLANLASDVLGGDHDRIPNPPLAAAAIKLGKSLVGDRVSGIARIYLPAFALLMEHQAQRDSCLARGLGSLSTGLMKSLEREIVASQDGDGAWAWTSLGTALCMMALKRQGHTLENSPTLRRAVGFLEQLRSVDIVGWTHGDAWDTAWATLTLPVIDDTSGEAVAKGIDAVLHGQLDDGRFSFSILGVLGDDDTTSVTLRTMCARFAKTDDPVERDRLKAAIAHTAEGLMAYQRSEGGWGAFNKRSLPFVSAVKPPSNPTISAFNDVQSPDLSARVLSSLVEARRSGALTSAQNAAADKAIAKARAYLTRTVNQDSSWWSRWTLGGLSGFAYIVPALRRAGVAPSAPVLERIPGLLLAKQNADGGWGEELAADRAPRKAGERGRSSVSHTASAIIGLIGTATENADPRVAKALAYGVDYLLRNDAAGRFSNGRHVYTQLMGLDYYECEIWTTCLAAAALQLYREYQRVGAETAMQRFAL